MNSCNSLLLKHGSILSPDGKLVVKDILIIDGIIRNIADNITQAVDQIINLDEKFISPGLIDMHVHLRDPGQTTKEDIITGTLAAAAGGFTHIASMPNTTPVTDSIQTISYILKKTQTDGVVNVLPVAAITEGLHGLKLTNFKDLKDAGAIAISDDGKGIQNDKIMEEAMNLASNLNMPILAHCEDERYLPHDSRSAEIEQIKRDIKLAQKSKCHYHVCHISCKESLQLIRQAKKDKINITCEVTPHHILLESNDKNATDTNYKMNPPLRTKDDLIAIKEALIDGTIDIIATDHAPHTASEKSQSYQNAPNGIIGMETAFPLLYTNLVKTKILNLQKLVDLMSLNASKIFSISDNSITINNVANLTVVDLKQERIVDSNKFLSKARNTPFNNYRLQGWPTITIIAGEIRWKM